MKSIFLLSLYSFETTWMNLVDLWGLPTHCLGTTGLEYNFFLYYLKTIRFDHSTTLCDNNICDSEVLFFRYSNDCISPHMYMVSQHNDCYITTAADRSCPPKSFITMKFDHTPV